MWIFPRFALLAAGSLALAFSSATAQVPNTLKLSIPAPTGGGAQSNAHFGQDVAADQHRIAVSSPNDSLGGPASGTVTIFDATTGETLAFLTNPSAARTNDAFGSAVVLSGSRLVVSAPFEDTNAASSGTVYVYDLSGATPSVPSLVIENPSPTTAGFGSALALENNRLVVTASGNGTTFPSTVHVYDLGGATPAAPVLTFQSPDVTVGDGFGRELALSGSKLLVSAPSFKVVGDQVFLAAGRAYLFDLNSGTPSVPTVVFDNPVPNANGDFGGALALSGNTAVIGAGGDDTGGADTGAVYIYNTAGATPSVAVTTIHPPAPAVGDQFGSKLALSGTQLLVGAFANDTGAPSAGVAYLFDLAGAPTVPTRVFNNPTPADSDYFGRSVAIAGTSAIIGAYMDDTNAADAGSAYLYDLGGATPETPIKTLANPSPTSGDNFGTALAISGTLLVVGDPLESTGAVNSGSVTVYDLAGPTPAVPVATFHNPSPGAGNSFGNAVGISGTRIVVGAYRNDAGASNAGAAYVYDLASATPSTPILVLNPPAPTASDQFGETVAISGTRVMVGCLNRKIGIFFGAGCAYVYDLAGATPSVPVFTLNDPTPASNDQFGSALAVSGNRVVVGARLDDGVYTDSGRVYVYDLGGVSPTVPVTTLDSPQVGSSYFGAALALEGSRLVVGSPQGSDGTAFASGRAYIYNLDGATPAVPEFTLKNPDPRDSDNFGNAVAISGFNVAVGTAKDDKATLPGLVDIGTVYVFNLSSPTAPVATIDNPAPNSDNHFGNSVAILGTTVISGSPGDDTVTTNKGAVYIFGPADNDTDHDGLLDLWEYARFGTTAGHGALDDADGDGLKEIAELAFDRDPTRPDAATSPIPVNEGGYLTLTIAKRAGVQYLIQSAGTPAAADFSASTTTVLIDNATTLKVRDNVPVATAGGRFMRVQISPQP